MEIDPGEHFAGGVKWLKIRQYFLQQKCSPQNLLFSDILFIAIFKEVTENECVMENQGQIT